MVDPAILAQPITGADTDRAVQLVQALAGLSDLIGAANDLSAVRPDRLACLLGSLVAPLEQELEALANRADAASRRPAAAA